MPTIIFQPPNRIGLGHLSRLIAIALAIREIRPDIKLPFVVAGDDHGLLEMYGLPHFALPDMYAMYQSGAWDAWPVAERHRGVTQVAAAMIEALAPGLILFDCVPHEPMAAAAVGARVPLAVCLRAMKQMAPFYDRIREYRALVRAVLLPHAPEEIDLPDDIASYATFTGPIVRPVPPVGAGDPEPPSGPFVVISGGGGGYPGTVAFYNLALRAFAHARAGFPALQGVLVTGPLFRDWQSLRTLDGVRLVPFDPHLSVTMQRARLVVCQAGYNTLAEVRAYGVPAVCVPAIRDADDQFARADRACAEPHIRTYAGEDPRRLGGIMIELLRDRLAMPAASRPGVTPPGLSPGARMAAETLLRTIDLHPPTSQERQLIAVRPA